MEQAVILIVDDNQPYREQLQRTIKNISPYVTTYEAENTQKALSLLQRITPQLVFVDVVLDEDDGISCTRQIKAHTPSCRVILISAYPDREFHRRGLEAGATAFLDKKDLNALALQQIIKDVIV